MNDPFHPYQFTETAGAESDREFLAQQIRKLNNSVSPHHLHIRTNPPEEIELMLRDDAGTIVGGLAASIYWSWLEIDKLWVCDDLRQHGLGRQLLQRVEALAIQRGCRAAHLTTFSFQARGFYEKYGYVVVGALTDFPPGATYYWMRKDLTPAD